MCPWALVGWGGGAHKHGRTSPAQRSAGVAGTTLRSRLAHAPGSLMEWLPVFHGLTPPQEGGAQPHKVPPTPLQPNCQLPSTAGPRCQQSLHWGKGTWGRDFTVKAIFLPWPPAICSHRTEPGLKALPCLPRCLVLTHLNGTVSALCAIPKLPLSCYGQLFLQVLLKLIPCHVAQDSAGGNTL